MEILNHSYHFSRILTDLESMIDVLIFDEISWTIEARRVELHGSLFGRARRVLIFLIYCHVDLACFLEAAAPSTFDTTRLIIWTNMDNNGSVLRHKSACHPSLLEWQATESMGAKSIVSAGDRWVVRTWAGINLMCVLLCSVAAVAWQTLAYQCCLCWAVSWKHHLAPEHPHGMAQVECQLIYNLNSLVLVGLFIYLRIFRTPDPSPWLMLKKSSSGWFAKSLRKLKY